MEALIFHERSPDDAGDVRPPDFDVTDAHRLWEPPPEVEGLPAVVAAFDPRPLAGFEDEEST